MAELDRCSRTVLEGYIVVSESLSVCATPRYSWTVRWWGRIRLSTKQLCSRISTSLYLSSLHCLRSLCGPTPRWGPSSATVKRCSAPSAAPATTQVPLKPSITLCIFSPVLYGCMFCELVLPVCATQPGAVTSGSTVFVT